MARDFVPASSEALTVGDVLEPTGDFTIAITVKSDNNSSRLTIASKYEASSGSNNRSWLIEQNADATIRILLSTDGTFQSGNSISSTGTLTQGITHTVMFVFEGSDTNAFIYIDGSVDGNDLTAPASLFNGNARFIIGAQDDIGGVNDIIQEWDGHISEVGYWNVALTAPEAAIYGKRFSPLFIRLSSLVSYWDLIRNINDRKGNNALSLIGTPTVVAHPSIIYPANVQVGVGEAAVPPVGITVLAAAYLRSRKRLMSTIPGID